MKKAFIRPLILLLVFFTGLYILREPLRNINSNFSLLKYQYIDPLFGWNGQGKSNLTDGDNNGTNNNSNPNSSPNSTASSTASNNGTDSNISGSSSANNGGSNSKPNTIPNTSYSSKDIIITSDSSINADASSLTISGVLITTNKERVAKQFPALKLNTALNKSASIKLQDMFTNQYFKHVSPKGLSVSDLVRQAEYGYIVVGENLALGNFGGDIPVVTAWMNSPGHRANILDPRYQDVGIAVGKGMYNGRVQWIAVQHFGKPLSSCEGPNPDLKDKIVLHTNELAAREAELATKRKEIETTTLKGPSYDQMVEEYNNLVVNYNTRLEGLKSEIATYNDQVRRFNECAGLK